MIIHTYIYIHTYRSALLEFIATFPADLDLHSFRLARKGFFTLQMIRECMVHTYIHITSYTHIHYYIHTYTYTYTHIHHNIQVEFEIYTVDVLRVTVDLMGRSVNATTARWPTYIHTYRYTYIHTYMHTYIQYNTYITITYIHRPLIISAVLEGLQAGNMAMIAAADAARDAQLVPAQLGPPEQAGTAECMHMYMYVCM